MVEYINFRYKLINNRYLITNDYYNWAFLSKSEFQKLQQRKIRKGSDLYQKLVDQNFIIDPRKVKALADISILNQFAVVKGPALHIIVVTKRCNQACKYCHASTTSSEARKYDLTKENAKKFVDLIMTSQSKAITIEFQGGEPLLNFDVVKYIYEYSQTLNKKLKKDIEYSIVTNLELMDDEKFNYLVKNKILLCTSLDGPKEIHDMNRPSIKLDSSYDKVAYWIKRCNQEKIGIGTLITVTRQALNHHKEIIDTYYNLGQRTIHLRFMNFLGKAIDVWKDIGYSADEFIDFWKKSVDYIIELNKKGILFNERYCMIMLLKIIAKQNPNYVDLMSPCGAVIGQIAYNYDGKIYTCDEGRNTACEMFQVGSTKCKSIKQIIESEKSLQFISSTINDQYFCDYCAYKAYCGICPVCNYIESGTIITDVLRSNRCKILTAMFDYIFEKLQDKETRQIFKSWVDKKIYKDNKVSM